MHRPATTADMLPSFKKPKAPVGRPPFPTPDLTPEFVVRLQEQARDLLAHKPKMKRWLAEKRVFHLLLQDYLATAPMEGASGRQLNASSSKLFLEMSEALVATLKGIESEDE